MSAAELPPRAPGLLERLAGWCMRRGWLHLLLLTLAGLFLSPLLWMASTSVKTDEELADPGLLPPAPRACPVSPYVRRSPGLVRPDGASEAQWPMLEALLLQRAESAVLRSLPPAPPVDPEAWCHAAGIQLARQVIARIAKGEWADHTRAGDAIDRACTLDAAAQALDASLARLELLGLELTTEDAQLFTLLDQHALASAVVVESGDAQLQTMPDALRLAYRFDHQDSPVVIAIPFSWPEGVQASQLHNLALQLRCDDSWHTITAELDAGGVHWRGTRSTPLAQQRQCAISFQPPSFDDSTYRNHSWVPLEAAGAVPLDARHGLLRLTIHRSGPLRVAWERMIRNYERAFLAVPFWTYVGNSTLLVALVVLGSLFSSAFVAYAFARLQWPGRSIAFMLLLATMMLPSQVTMVPSFLVWRSLGWYNTLNPLWVGAWLGNAFFIYLMVQQLRTIPKELEEAARIDGLNALQTWWYVIVPQLAPSLAAIAVMSFLGAWNDFMGPLVFLRDQSRFPLSLGLFGMKVDGTATDFGMQMAGNLLMTLPTVLVFFCFQRYFIQGMASSGIKG